jgi:PIN domain nuclease of toxin-antitoxin system
LGRAGLELRIHGPFSAAVEASGFVELPITFRHTAHGGGLPPHHTDPFDRILVAQSVTDGLTLVTRDRAFAPYGVPVIWT